MRYWIFFVVSVLGMCVLSSCAHRNGPAELKSSLLVVRQYADSFSGLSLSEARTRLAGGKLSEGEWSGEGFGGKELVATFAHHEVRVLFLDGKAITTSIQVLSE